MAASQSQKRRDSDDRLLRKEHLERLAQQRQEEERGILTELHQDMDKQVAAKLFGPRTAPEMLLPVLAGRKASSVSPSEKPGEKTVVVKFPAEDSFEEKRKAA